MSVAAAFVHNDYAALHFAWLMGSLVLLLIAL